MWYLIIPPIIVVVSLFFVLWYLSRKGADPLIALKALQSGEEAERRVAFLRTKNFSLHLLEKIAYRFKVASLKMHNALHDLTQSLKASQRRFQPQAPTSKLSGQKDTSEQEQVIRREKSLPRFFGKEKKEDGIEEEALSSETAVLETTLDVPIMRSRKVAPQIERPAGTLQAGIAEESRLAARQMVSEIAAHPERARGRMPTNSFHEEDFIARIAANPKDFTAYEGLGDYYLETGNIKDAKECYRQVLKLSPAQRMVKIKIRRLEKILSQKAE